MTDKNISISLFSYAIPEVSITYITQNKMCFFNFMYLFIYFKKTDIHLLYICWSLFWQSSDYPIYYQSPEEPAQIVNGKTAAESNTSPSGKAQPCMCTCVCVISAPLSLEYAH